MDEIKIQVDQIPEFLMQQMFRGIRRGILEARKEPGYQERLERYRQERRESLNAQRSGNCEPSGD